MKLEISRTELSDLIMACSVCEFMNGMVGSRYDTLHRKLEDKLKEYDLEQARKEILREVTK